MTLRSWLAPLALCALVAGCSTTIKYPTRWGPLAAAGACSELVGVWSDQGQYIGDLGARPQSLAGIFGRMSSLKAFSSLRNQGNFDKNNRAVRIQMLPEGVLRVTTIPLPGGKANRDDYRCAPAEGWARITDSEAHLIGGVPSAGFAIGVPGLGTHLERLDFRKAEDGALIARWLTRDTTYVTVLPFEEDYLRWARFTAYAPPAPAMQQSLQGAR